MTLFDRYLVVDWSAAAQPKTGTDSIWIADLSNGDALLTNPSTRQAAFAQIREAIAASGGRTLIGFDASLGYPAGTAAYFGFEQPGWRGAWNQLSMLSDRDDRNRNNRFDVASALNKRGPLDVGPFWGCPPTKVSSHLRATKPAKFAVPEFREVEQHLRSVGRYPKSAWQLLGAGSVGSQTLTLLPYLWPLLDQIDVWPFTTGLAPPSGDRAATVVEVWPSLFDPEVPAGTVVDAAQVSHTARVLRAADRSGELATWFTPTTVRADTIVIEEGWVLGVR